MSAKPIKTILIIDDSPTDRAVLSALLKKAGYRCLTAASGEEGIEVSRSCQPSAILMDVVMPGISGFQATRVISGDQSTRHIPVIMCSSKANETDRIWGIRQGAVDYLVKPVSGSDLIDKVRTATVVRKTPAQPNASHA